MTMNSGTSNAGQPVHLSSGTVWAMAVACGFAVANTYYNQPMMVDIALDLETAESSAGLIPTMTQAGYATGLLFLAPLGDRYERRSLILIISVLLILSLLSAGFASSFTAIVAASFAVGVFSTLAQQIVPMAAQLARPERRGSVIGIVMAGLLTGILGARTLAGFVAEYWGWRAMFLTAAVIMIAVALLVRLTFPSVKPASNITYGALMRSLVPIWRQEPVVREASIIGAFAFGTFSIFWSTLTPHLASPSFGLGPSVAGMFGLAGILGAVAATLAGRFADSNSPRAGIGYSVGMMFAAFGVFALFGNSMTGLILGVLLLDIGMQGTQILGQARIFAIQGETRSRINTIYMTCFFIGGASGSALGTFAWDAGGWIGVTIAGMATSFIGIVLHALGPHIFGRSPTPRA